GDRSPDKGQHDGGQSNAVDRRARGLRGQAADRQGHQPPLQLERLLAFGGGRADPERGEDHHRQQRLLGHGHLRRNRARRGRDIEVKIAPTTTITIPDADVATMKANDPKPYDQATRDAAVKLFMELMAFSAAADYSRVAVLKIGDRIDDHVYTYNGQSAKFHD